MLLDRLVQRGSCYVHVDKSDDRRHRYDSSVSLHRLLLFGCLLVICVSVCSTASVINKIQCYFNNRVLNHTDVL